MNIETGTKKSTKDQGSRDRMIDEMQTWSHGLLQNLYNDAGDVSTRRPHQFIVNTKIDDLVDDHTTSIGEEKILLTEKFTETLIDFSQNIYFDRTTDPEKIKAYYSKIRSLFFSSSPNILENLKENLMKNILLTGKMYEVGGLYGVAHSQTKKLSYELSYVDDESFEELFNKTNDISAVDQIRLVRELGRIAASALSDGSWAYPAYERSKELMENIKESSSPIIQMMADRALDELGIYEARYLDSDFEKYNEVLEKRQSRLKETDNFLGHITLVPDIQHVIVEKTSDHHATVSARNGDAPIGLINISSVRQKEDSKFSGNELDALKRFSEFLQNDDIPLAKIILNAFDFENDLGIDRFSIDPFIASEHAKNIRTHARRFLDLESKMQSLSTEIYHSVEQENLKKTHELFDYFESLPDEKLNRHEQRARRIYNENKEKNYEEGMFSAISFLSSTADLVPDDLSETSTSLIKRINELREYHISQWEGLDERIEGSIQELRDEMSQEARELAFLENAFEREGFEVWLQELIQKEDSQKTSQPIQRFEDVIAPYVIDQESITESVEVMRFMLSRETQEFLNKKLSIQFDELDLKDQVYFSRYLIDADINQFDDVIRVMNAPGLESTKFIHTFLALAHGGDQVSEKIIDLADQLPIGIANKIFEKYGEIVDRVDQVISFAQHNFRNEIAIDSKAIHEIQESLYRRALALLNNFHDDINKDKNLAERATKIESQLDRIKSDTITTLAIFKQALRTGNKLPLEDIKGAIFESRSASDFTPTEINEMRELYKINWEHYEDRNVAGEIFSYFEKTFDKTHSENNTLYVFKKDEHIRAFVRFEKKEDGSLYASALNVDQSMQGLSLGEAMMDEALRKEAQTSILRASSERTKKESMRYFEMGFVATGLTTHSSPLFHIEWNEQKNQQYQSKKMSQEELATIFLVDNDPPFDIRRAPTLQELHQEFPEGKVMTRCFPDPIAGRGWYAVYENAITGSDNS